MKKKNWTALGNSETSSIYLEVGWADYSNNTYIHMCVRKKLTILKKTTRILIIEVLN